MISQKANIQMYISLTGEEEKERESSSESKSSSSPASTQAALNVIQRRRRPKRRSTGVGHVDMDVSTLTVSFYAQACPWSMGHTWTLGGWLLVVICPGKGVLTTDPYPDRPATGSCLAAWLLERFCPGKVSLEARTRMDLLLAPREVWGSKAVGYGNCLPLCGP